MKLTRNDYALVLGGLASMKAGVRRNAAKKNPKALGELVWRLEQLIDHFEMEARSAPYDDDE